MRTPSGRPQPAALQRWTASSGGRSSAGGRRRARGCRGVGGVCACTDRRPYHEFSNTHTEGPMICHPSERETQGAIDFDAALEGYACGYMGPEDLLRAAGLVMGATIPLDPWHVAAIAEL